MEAVKLAVLGAHVPLHDIRDKRVAFVQRCVDDFIETFINASVAYENTPDQQVGLER